MRLWNGFPALMNAAAAPVTFGIGAVAANTTAVATTPVAGAQVGDAVQVIPRAALEAGTGIVGARVSVAGTVELTMINTTAGPLPAAAQSFDVMILPRN